MHAHAFPSDDIINNAHKKIIIITHLKVGQKNDYFYCL